ncbi:MAG TPA: quinone oxidoreductase [Burkholderiales bacterium]|jgi:NADPH2:quinone reductase|nr:quinone oxidoreductase [Burkholderiales bacterium]
MRTISIAAFGGPDVLQPVATDRPRPQPSEVLVKLDYAGINYTDIYQRGGLYARSHTYQTPLPMVIGMEGAGTVAAVGDGVTDFRPGERVAYCIVRGSYAEYAAVPARRLVKLPDDIDVRTGAALMLQGLTAHYLAHSAFQLKAGTSCLVHAAAGGVGQLLTQIAKIAGATVIGTVGSHEKAEIAKARGVDHVVLYRETDFRDAVRELTGGIGVDVVYDAVGKDTIAGSIRSLKRRGLCVNYGGASGLVESIEPLELAEAGSVFFTRPHLADYLATPEELRARAADLFQWIREGRLTVPVDREFPLAQAADAHRYLEARKTRGKLLLKI